jgi:hypothetical protein
MELLKCKQRILFVLVVLILLLFSSCSLDSILSKDYHQNIIQAEIAFIVNIPKNTRSENGIFLEILDEVTGLGLNPMRYQLTRDANDIFTFKMPFTMGAVLKYRYVRGGTPPMVEYTSQNVQIRYRLIKINGSIIVHDTVAAWQYTPFQGNTGTLQGFIFDNSTNVPLVNVMVIIDGMRTFTASDGSYTINGVPVGEQNLVAYHLNGSFQTFQQGAVIAANATTPANFGMVASKMVNITFKVIPPSDHLSGAPIRLVGNSKSLGNTFDDLEGGISTKAIQSPEMTYNNNSTYSIIINLPAGHYLEYKYSLGDGFWNAEHSKDGSWKLRQIIIPDQDTVINDTIDSWNNSSNKPITFNIVSPANTPQNDFLSIQFNPFVWMEPIPMWYLGNNRWTYVLYSPFEFLSNTSYRVILNDQGGPIDDIATQGQNSHGLKINLDQPSINYSIQDWAFIK